MTRLGPAMRISLGLIMAVVSIILLSDLIGIIPDRSSAVIDGRKRIAETVAVQYSMTIRKNDYDSIAASLKMLVERNDDVLSAALRAENGRLIAVSGDHEARWDTSLGDKSTATQMQVPLYKNARLKQKWGSVELRFRPVNRTRILGFEISSMLVLTLFVAIFGFLVFLFLVKKIFTSIDPGSVVPSRVKRALDTLTEGVLLIDNKGIILFVNTTFLTATGTCEKELIGKRAASLSWKNYGDEIPWLKTLQSGFSATGETIALESPDQADRQFTVNSSPVLDEKGVRKGAMVTFDDVTELEERNDALREMVRKLRESSELVNRKNEELLILATHDPLTNCKNRRVLFSKYEGVYHDAIEGKSEFCCLMIDIDHFKRINDNYGHAAGDAVLKAVADALRGMLRGEDEVFRYGGEEFCMLLPETYEVNAQKLAERLRRNIELQRITEAVTGDVISVTASLGVSSINSGSGSLSELIEQADIALYHSKNTGRNRVSVWSEMTHKTEPESASAQGGYQILAEHVSASGSLDHVTGLPSRINFREKLAQSIVKSRETGKHTAVLLVDLDTFQRINNVFGYTSGDTVLNTVAQRLSQSLRASDALAKLPEGLLDQSVYGLGGDEFGVLLAEMSASDDVNIVVERLINSITEPFEVDGHQVHMTASIGGSRYPSDGEDAETLITRAGLALQQAKRMGNQNCLFFRDEYISTVRQDYEIEKDLRRALQANEFELYFQPQLDLASLKVVSMEALIRWHHPERGMVSPAEFIPVAEASGLIVNIGQWVIETACRQIRIWLDEGIVLPVAVNISALQFRHKSLIEQIRNAVASARINTDCLELEITESTIMENVGHALETMEVLRKYGHRITIDDFGTGYSSLEYLKRFPVSTIKIDRAFIKNVDEDQSDAAIVRAAVTMAHGMNMKVVAEGVENEQQLFFLRNLRCDMVQGYLLGQPLPASEALALVDENHRQANLRAL
ncbi:MAG: diguanylate cyclase [Gammaproteobacteria bacterium]